MGVGVTGTDDGSSLAGFALMSAPVVAGASIPVIESVKSNSSLRYEEMNLSPVDSSNTISIGAWIQLDERQPAALDSVSSVDKSEPTKELEIRLNDDFFFGFDSIESI